jgi:protein MpaA
MLGLVVAGVLAAAQACQTVSSAGRQDTAAPNTPPASSRLPRLRPPPVDLTVRRTQLLGRSTHGAQISAVELGDPDSPRKLLVVGCVHGNEPDGIAVADAIAGAAPLSEADIWVVADANPDGVRGGTRQNARGVDLNRNFPFRWRDLGPPGSTHYAGPAALSESESQLLAHLIERIRPAITIWFHQALNVVDASGGDIRVERHYAGLARQRLMTLPRYPGSAVGWENHLLPGTTAFVDELPAVVGRADVRRFAAAALTLFSGP